MQAADGMADIGTHRRLNPAGALLAIANAVQARLDAADNGLKSG